jgi:hypothetical protein
MKELGQKERIIKLSEFENYHAKVSSNISGLFTKL